MARKPDCNPGGGGANSVHRAFSQALAGRPMSGPPEFDMFGEIVRNPHGSLLGDEFVVPPFSVLNAREGWWQERKRKWLALGIQSELGRGLENLGMAHPETTSTVDFYARKRALEAEHGRTLSKDEAAALMGGGTEERPRVKCGEAQ